MSNLVCHKSTIILIADLLLTIPPTEQAKGDALTQGKPEPQPAHLKVPAGTTMIVRSVSKIEPKTVQLEFTALLAGIENGPDGLPREHRFLIPLPLAMVKECTRPKLVPKSGQLITARPS